MGKYLPALNEICAITPLLSRMDCTHLRELATNALQDHCYDASIFYANKLVTLEPQNPEYVLLLCRGYYCTAQYRRVIHSLQDFLPRPLLSGGMQLPRNIDPKHASVIDYLKCLHLAGKSYIQLSQSQDCVELLQNFDAAAASHWKEDVNTVVERVCATRSSRETKVSSLLCLLRAEALESIDVRSSALIWYKKALLLDVTCVEAWKRLSEGFMLLPDEETALLDSLVFPPQLDWLKTIYTCKSSNFMANHNVEIHSTALQRQEEVVTKKMPVPAGVSAPPKPIPVPTTSTKSSESLKAAPISTASGTAPLAASSASISSSKALVSKLETKYGLGMNADVVACRAQAAFYGNQIRESFRLTSSVLERDPYCMEVMATHLSSLVELGSKNELYLLAHKMAENAPKSAMSWYAVGCYYFLIRSWQNARLYFGKATALNREFGAAWLAYGYTFAQNGDHDQALSAYRTAARLLVGSHLPTLLIAVELVRTKDLVLAKQFAQKAKDMHPYDPYPVHELGVIHLRSQEYDMAIQQFEKVFALLGGRQAVDASWEPTVFNLAQAHIKLKQYSEALPLLEWSLALLPYNVATYSSLAFVHHVSGNLSEAIDCYHHVLSLAPEDAFAIQALEDALTEWVSTRVHDDIVPTLEAQAWDASLLLGDPNESFSSLV